ncbi:MAG: T9SS type A sorting domain-containing protein [Bacteroidota bacterium]
MKKLFLLLSFLPLPLLAQYAGGEADGAASSDAVQLDLEGIPSGVRGLYVGGEDDGFARGSGFGSLGNSDFAVIYQGGSDDGFASASGSSSISGVDLIVLYGGGDGDGYSYLQGSQSLDGISLEGIYGGGSGDGFDQLQFAASLDGQSTALLYGGGPGDGYDWGVSSGSLGEMLMLYGGGPGDGYDRQSGSFSLDGDDLVSLFGGGPGDGFARSDFYGVVPVPLTLISFQAFPEETYVLLKWVTEDEVNTDFFTIEKTRTGREFATVGNTPAAGFSLPGEQLHYEMKDYAPYSGKSYYRLKTTDFDGFISLSHLVEVNYDGKQDWGFTLFPNPNSGQHFNIRTSGLEAGEEVTLEVFDVQGRLIQRNPLTAMEQDTTLIRLQQKLSSGSYLIRLSHPEEGQQSKILLVGER